MNDRLDSAARAAWLYYVAGQTQDEIARALGVSRQSAQRLVALAVAEGLVRVRIGHPLGRCMELARALKDRFGLAFCHVAPSAPGVDLGALGVDDAAAAEMEKYLRREEPTILAVGTGRTLKAAAERLPRLDRPDHRIVSLTGSIHPDGSAATYNVIFTMADRIAAPSFPMPLPVIASSAEERRVLHEQPAIRRALDLAAQADAAFVGVGEFDETAPLFVDGFLTGAERDSLRASGAVGEITGWIFDAEGRVIEGDVRGRVASAPLPDRARTLVIGCAMGARKRPALAAALKGALINGLITNEAMAEALLSA